MHITELRIRNFRNFLKARVRFLPGVNTLIGENGSGKTNALHALRLLLDESLPRNTVYLRDSDFCRELGNWRGHWIVISADFAALDPSEGCQLLRHTTGHMNQTDTGTCTLFFRPKGEVRNRLKELADEGEGLSQYLEKLTTDDYEPVFTGRGRGDFLDDDVYREWVGEPGASSFPSPEDDDLDTLGVRIPSLHQEVACTFVRALRDVVTELRAYRGNPLLTLLRGVESSLEIADSERIVQRVAELNMDISSLTEIKRLADGIETALRNSVGLTYAPGVTIESALPDSMEKLLQRLCVLVGDSDTSDYRGELHEQSLGGANLIYLALKYLEYETKLVSDRVAHFLLIEEPESHIHTHVQKTLFTRLPTSRTQVIVSTHSTHISSAARIASVNVLAKRSDYVEVFQPANGLAPEKVSRVERYLDAVRSTLLFAKGVLLVEGDAEQIMIPAMLRTVFGMTPDELGFSVIAMNSAVFENIALIFASDRIRRPCAIATDLDAPLGDLPDDPGNDTPVEAQMRRAARVGERRANALQELTTGNPWIRAFFATYTFEVDFVLADNSWEVVQTLDEIFDQEPAKRRCRQRLESGDSKTSGAEVLRLADKQGKGWFSLLLAEKLTADTCIPDYLLRAVAFACHQSVPVGALKQIGLFRVRDEDEVEGVRSNFKDRLPSLNDLTNLNAEEFVSIFCESEPEDSLSRFCHYVKECRAHDPSESGAEEGS